MPPPASTTRDARIWQLLVEENVDDPTLNVGTRIVAQFPPQQMSHDLNASIPEAGGFSRENPLIQWVGGELETVTFQARLYSDTRTDFTARDKLEILKNLRRPHSPLGRPPLVRFFWGNMIPGGISCFIKSLGGIQYDEIKRDGTIRGATLNISLTKWTDYRMERRVIAPSTRTPTYVVKDGMTYEMIAMEKYGDPLIGVALRQQNPRFPMERWAPRQYADLRTNEIIKLFPKTDLDSKRIRPESHIFNEDDSLSAGNRRRVFALRATKANVMLKR